MKKKLIANDMPIGKLTRVRDTLPPPEELMAGDMTVKVTLRLSQTSIRFFKQYAHKYHTKYQKVIRRLVDLYAERYGVPKET